MSPLPPATTSVPCTCACATPYTKCERPAVNFLSSVPSPRLPGTASSLRLFSHVRLLRSRITHTTGSTVQRADNGQRLDFVSLTHLSLTSTPKRHPPRALGARHGVLRPGTFVVRRSWLYDRPRALSEFYTEVRHGKDDGVCEWTMGRLQN